MDSPTDSTGNAGDTVEAGDLSYGNTSTSSSHSERDSAQERSHHVDLVSIPAGLPTSQRTQGAFVAKLYTMVATPALDHLICWSEDGLRFSIVNPTEFSKILPQFFKHNNPQSFIRQLNIYNFHKVQYSGSALLDHSSEVWEFEHPSFRRGCPHLLPQVKRQSRNPVPLGVSRSSNKAEQESFVRKRSASATPESVSSPEPEVGNGESGQGEGYPGYHWDANAPSSSTHPAGFKPRGRPPTHKPFFESRPTHRAPSPSNRFAPGSNPPPHRPSRPASPLPPAREVSDHHLKQQISALESRVGVLTDVLQRSQHESSLERMATATVVRQLLNVVMALDVKGRHQHECEAAAAALASLSRGSPSIPRPPSPQHSAMSRSMSFERSSACPPRSDPQGRRSFSSDLDRGDFGYPSPSYYHDYPTSFGSSNSHTHPSLHHSSSHPDISSSARDVKPTSSERQPGRLPPLSSLFRDREMDFDTEDSERWMKRPRY